MIVADVSMWTDVYKKDLIAVFYVACSSGWQHVELLFYDIKQVYVPDFYRSVKSTIWQGASWLWKIRNYLTVGFAVINLMSKGTFHPMIFSVMEWRVGVWPSSVGW